MTHQNKLLLQIVSRLAKWPVMCGLLVVILAQEASATQSVYEVDSSVFYGPTQVPVIDATNFFVNYATYFAVELGSDLPFETYNTVNYTNFGTMEIDNAFQFDTQTTNAFGNSQHLMAGNFYNPGSILCGSVNGFVGSVGLPQCLINATNVINNNGGLLDVGGDGLIQITGQNVDLGAGVLTVDGNGLGSVQALPISVNGLNAGLYLAGSGVDTNKDWDPSVELSVSTATPGDVKIGTFTPAFWENPFVFGFGITTIDSTPYSVVTEVATNDFIYRSIFLENFAPNVTANAYINGQLLDLPGTGEAAVEFIGTYTNPVTGAPSTQYLYVRDDYALGATTNVPLNTANHVPDNFTFTTATQSLVPGDSPATSSFIPFPAGILTNAYAYADVQCIPTTVPTNALSIHVTNYLANMVGSIQVLASNNLNLAGVQIYDQNYISLSASNEVTGTAGAAIVSPYADINVAATNMNLMATNLLEPSTPAWNGYLGAWNTRWLYTTSNSIITYSNSIPISTNSYAITNDYRVFIIFNTATPGTSSSVWNLGLRDTNNTVISDVYNVLNNMYMNCTSLTVTTNSPGPGSPCGELNLLATSVNWASATPNLRYLTNDGEIFLPNQGIFGSSSAPYGALINGGLIEDGGSQIWAGNFVDTGSFLNGAGSFILNSQTTMLTNCSLAAVGDMSITTGSLITSNLTLEADRSLTLIVTNLLTDTGVTNDSTWIVGDASIGNGLKVPFLPAIGDLRGTSIYDYAPTNRTIINVWPGVDKGVANVGYSNNLAVGQLILDAEGSGPLTQLYFSGAGTSNAIYVDHLILNGYASYLYHSGTNSLPAVVINTNLVIYYADATASGVGDVSFLLNGFNGNHLRWVPTYVGYFSATNIVYPNGSTNALNIGLVDSPFIDSNGNGTGNSSDPTPLFVTSQLSFTDYRTNNPPNTVAISWNSVPLATNFLYYSTNLLSWQLLTNAYLMTNPFISPEPYPGPITNITVLDPDLSPGRFYQVVVNPDLLNP